MKNKQTRNLKVYSQGQNGKWNVTSIILKGDCLKQLGFYCSSAIEVICEKDKLIILNKVE